MYIHYVLKEIIDTYRVLNGSIFVCFLDASKAFDRVNQSKSICQAINLLVRAPEDVCSVGGCILHEV